MVFRSSVLERTAIEDKLHLCLYIEHRTNKTDRYYKYVY